MERGCCVINYINKLTIKNIMKLIVECNTQYIKMNEEYAICPE